MSDNKKLIEDFQRAFKFSRFEERHLEMPVITL